MLEKKNEACQKEVSQLKNESGGRQKEVYSLKTENEALRKEVDSLKKENEARKEEIELLKIEAVLFNRNVQTRKSNSKTATAMTGSKAQMIGSPCGILQSFAFYPFDQLTNSVSSF